MYMYEQCALELYGDLGTSIGRAMLHGTFAYTEVALTMSLRQWL